MTSDFGDRRRPEWRTAFARTTLPASGPSLWDRLWALVAGDRSRVTFAVGPAGDCPPPAKTPDRRGITDPSLESAVDIKLTDSQQTTLRIGAARDKRGNPVDLAGKTFQFLTDNTDLLALTPGADGTSCRVAAVGPLGTATVSATATDNSVAGKATVTVVSGAAVTIDLTADAPAEEPDAPAPGPAPAAA